MRKWLGLLVVILGLAQGLKPAATQESSTSLDDAIRGYESASQMVFHGMPEDWSTHHVSFSPAARGSAAQTNPRYWLQQIRHGLAAGAPSASLAPLNAAFARRRPTHRDWSEDLGPGGTGGSAQFPAKFSFSANGTPSCTNDFVIFNTGLAGSATQASIVAYNQLYKTPTCAGVVPATLWAYNTGGMINLSPILSLDGTQVAFVQTTDGVASLVVLKWQAGGSVSAPATLSSTSGYGGCTAPCMISLTFNGSPNDTTSAPFYDYGGSDTLYVGDSAGNLHAFHPVFNGGTPAEVTTGGFPVTVSQNRQPLADPVYDAGFGTGGTIFVGDGHVPGASTDGEVHAVTAATAAVVNSASVCHGSGFLDGPILDPVAGRIYFTCGHDVGGGACPTSGTKACIRQFAEATINGSSGTPEPLGTNLDVVVPPGAFDNLYLGSSGSTPTGNLYICGDPGGVPTLFRVPVTSNVIGTPVAVANLSSSTAATCSPVTEFYNTSTSTDWIFMGVSAAGSQNGCSGTTGANGCVYSFNATAALNAGATATAGLAATGGSSGLIVDNIGAAGSTVANVYFSTLADQTCGTSGTGGCAVQASQDALR